MHIATSDLRGYCGPGRPSTESIRSRQCSRQLDQLEQEEEESFPDADKNADYTSKENFRQQVTKCKVPLTWKSQVGDHSHLK